MSNQLETKLQSILTEKTTKIIPGNIKKDVTIFDVTGTYEGGGGANLQPNKNATPTTSQQIITPDSGYDGLEQVTVAAVTSAIDANIVSGNIKKDVTILGVTGTHEGGIDTSDATATAASILSGDTAYAKGEKITGTMTNNGVLIYPVSTSQQTIPAGYTSGGTIAASPIDQADYNTCLSLAEDILGISSNEGEDD